MLDNPPQLGVSSLWQISGVAGLTRFEPTTHWYVHKTSQKVLDHGNDNVKMTIGRSNLLNLDFFARFVLVGVYSFGGQVEYSCCKQSK